MFLGEICIEIWRVKGAKSKPSNTMELLKIIWGFGCCLIATVYAKVLLHQLRIWKLVFSITNLLYFID